MQRSGRRGDRTLPTDNLCEVRILQEFGHEKFVWTVIPGMTKASWPISDPARILREHLSAEQFASCCDRLWSTDRRSTVVTDRSTPFRHGSIVYAKQDHTTNLFPQLGRRRARIVLVTAESDVSVGPCASRPAQVAAWFAVNALGPAVQTLPLGLGNSYCERTVKADALAGALGTPKEGLLYLNFRAETNPSVRVPLLEKFRSSGWDGAVTRQDPSGDPAAYTRSLASHRYVLCPGGNGTDTHRMWEALYAGAVPVVQRHPALDSFRDLPILFVDDLLALDKSLLEASYPGILQTSWNTDKMFLPYWRDRFGQARLGLGRPVGFPQFLAARLRTGPLARFLPVAPCDPVPVS
jgi:hypothetical protein